MTANHSHHSKYENQFMSELVFFDGITLRLVFKLFPVSSCRYSFIFFELAA